MNLVAHKLMQIEGVTACAIAVTPASMHSLALAPEAQPSECAGTSTARTLARVSAMLCDLSKEGQASVNYGDFRCLVIWNTRVTIAVTMPTGHRVAKSMVRTLRRLIAKHYPETQTAKAG